MPRLGIEVAAGDDCVAGTWMTPDTGGGVGLGTRGWTM
jgi:hypothetical protein